MVCGARRLAVVPMAGLLFVGLEAGELEHAEVKLWKGGTFHQETVDLAKYREGVVRAKVDGEWGEFRVRELPKKFLEWNIEKRLETLEKIREKEPPSFAGPHSAMVATQGIRRLDSQFTINNAVKGMGFIPKRERLKGVIDSLKATMDKPFLEKLDVLEGFYRGADELFDPTKQLSLELYSTPEFETHSFLNQMVNPGVAVVFLDIPCFELKAIAQLLHPDDPKLSQYDKDVVEYTNLIHDYFHGESRQKFIAVIYHIIEVYDNTPSKGRGVRIVPAP